MDSEQGLTPELNMINKKEETNNRNNTCIGEKTNLPVGAEHVATRVNALMQNLDRASRSNDPPECSDPECDMNDENNDNFGNYNARKRKTRCYICGDRNHEGRLCKKVTVCFICSKKGHLVVDCPNKNVEVDLTSRLCLKCGNTGHDMFSCVNNYDSEDLKAIECYICTKAGHLCCAGDKTILIGASCYSCGQSGHFGWECTRPNGAYGPGPFCKKCQTRGHHIRLCPQKKQVKTVAEKATERKTKRATQANTAAGKAAARTEKRKARRARKLKTNNKNTNMMPIVNANPNQLNALPLPPIVGSHLIQPGSTVCIPPPVSNGPSPLPNGPNQLNAQPLPPIVGSHLRKRGSTVWIPPPVSNGPSPLPNGPGPLLSHQPHTNYKLGTRVPNSFSPPTHFPRHFYPNPHNRPPITQIPFNQERRVMAPPGTGIRRPMVQLPVLTQISHVIQHNPRQPFSHQPPWTASHIPPNSTNFPAQYPHATQNNPRQPKGHQTVIARPSMGSHNPQQYPPRPGWTFYNTT